MINLKKPKKIFIAYVDRHDDFDEENQFLYFGQSKEDLLSNIAKNHPFDNLKDIFNEDYHPFKNWETFDNSSFNPMQKENVEKYFEFNDTESIYFFTQKINRFFSWKNMKMNKSLNL